MPSSRLDAAFNRFTPSRPLTPQEALQLRVVAGGAILGLFVATVSTITTLALYENFAPTAIVGFGIGCAGLLAATRVGIRLPVLRWSALILVGGFLAVQCLQTAVLDASTLKWLTLLPLISLMLGDAPTKVDESERLMPSLWSGAGLALLLSAVIIVCNRLGWTGSFDAQDTPVRGISVATFVDYAMFLLSVAGLLTVHRMATRRMEDELRMLRTMLAVCAWCQRVRDDDDGWITPDRYIARHGDHTLTHGMCPECERTIQRQLN